MNVIFIIITKLLPVVVSLAILLTNFTLHYKKCKTFGLKRNKLRILSAWLLLFCFIGGQYMVYVHQHNILQKMGSGYSLNKNQQKPTTTVQEKCYLCDAMHHTAMVIESNVYFTPVFSTDHLYKVGDYDFVSIALVLSAGRAPPVTSISC